MARAGSSLAANFNQRVRSGSPMPAIIEAALLTDLLSSRPKAIRTCTKDWYLGRAFERKSGSSLRQCLWVFTEVICILGDSRVCSARCACLDGLNYSRDAIQEKSPAVGYRSQAEKSGAEQEKAK
jgi:hypothetical protein